MANARIETMLRAATIERERRTGRGRRRAGRVNGGRTDPDWREMMSLVSFETTRRAAV
jgi:hypothetical protein